MLVGIIDRGVVYAGRRGTMRQSLTFPHICVLPCGRWLCTFRAAPAKKPNDGQHVLLTWSDNQGKSWHEPIEPFLPVRINDKPGLIRAAGLTAMDSRRTIAAICWVDYSCPGTPFFNETTEGLLDTKILLSHSDDRGITWSQPAVLQTPDCPVPTPITGPILRLNDGGLACHFELNKHYNDPQVWRHSSVMMFSRDNGSMWGRPVTVTNDPGNRFFYWDQRPSVLDDGSIMDVFWTFDKQAAAYVNIHARQSRDCGRNWSEIWDTGVSGQPAPVRNLSDGKLLMVYVERERDTAIKACVSSDGGRTWPDETQSVIYTRTNKSESDSKSSMQDAWSEMSKFSIGLPHTERLNDGSVLVVYYAGEYPDQTSIEWVRLI